MLTAAAMFDDVTEAMPSGGRSSSTAKDDAYISQTVLTRNSDSSLNNQIRLPAMSKNCDEIFCGLKTGLNEVAIISAIAGNDLGVKITEKLPTNTETVNDKLYIINRQNCLECPKPNTSNLFLPETCNNKPRANSLFNFVRDKSRKFGKSHRNLLLTENCNNGSAKNGVPSFNSTEKLKDKSSDNSNDIHSAQNSHFNLPDMKESSKISDEIVDNSKKVHSNYNPHPSSLRLHHHFSENISPIQFYKSPTKHGFFFEFEDVSYFLTDKFKNIHRFYRSLDDISSHSRFPEKYAQSTPIHRLSI